MYSWLQHMHHRILNVQILLPGSEPARVRRRLTPADALSHPFFSAVSPARVLLAAQAPAAWHHGTSSEAPPVNCAHADGVAAAAHLSQRAPELRAPAVEGLGFVAAARDVWRAAEPCAAATDGGRDVDIAWAQEGPELGKPEAGMDAAFALEAQSATTMVSSAEARALGAGLALAPDAAQGPGDRSRPHWHAAGRASPGSDAGQSVAPEVLRPAPVAYAHAASAVTGAGQNGARCAAAHAAPPLPVLGGVARQLPLAAGSAHAAHAPGTSPAVHRPAPGGPADPPEHPPVPPVLLDVAAASAKPAAAAAVAEPHGTGALAGGWLPMPGLADGAPICLAPGNPGAVAGSPAAGGGGRRPAAGPPAAEGPVPGSAATPVRTRRAWEAVSTLLGEASPGETPGRPGTLETPYLQGPVAHAQQPGAAEPGSSPSPSSNQAPSRQRPATPGRLQQPLLRGPAGRAALAADSELTLSGSGGAYVAVNSVAEPSAEEGLPQLGARTRACGAAAPDRINAAAAGARAAPGLRDPGGSAAPAPAPDPSSRARTGAPAAKRPKLGSAVLSDAQAHEDRGQPDALAPTRERPPGAAIEAASATGRRCDRGETAVDAEAAGDGSSRQRKRGRSEGRAPDAGRAPPLRSPRVGTQAPASADALTPGVPEGGDAPSKRSLDAAGTANPVAAVGGAGGVPPGGQAAAPVSGSPNAARAGQGAAQAPRQRRGRTSEKQAKPWWVV